MTKPLPLKVGDRVSITETSSAGVVGVVIHIHALVGRMYRVKHISGNYYSMGNETIHLRRELRKLPDRKEGA